MNRILKNGSDDIKITNARKIVYARNYIIHGYDSLSVDILWSIVINHLPLLKEEVTLLMKFHIKESSFMSFAQKACTYRIISISTLADMQFLI